MIEQGNGSRAAAQLVAFGLIAAPHLSLAWLMRLSGALPLAPSRAQNLCAVVAALSRRAGLERAPDLDWVSRGYLNAFAVGGLRGGGDRR